MKASAAVHWWDEGRARWRSRPANKERSYDEPVHSKTRPSKVKSAGERCSVHAALSVYAARGYGPDDEGDTGEHLLDAAARHRSMKHERWHHAGPRRDHIASAQARRVRNQGRKFTSSKFFTLPPMTSRLCAELATELFTPGMRREAVRRACYATIGERVFQYGTRFWTAVSRDAVTALMRDPDFVAVVPAAQRVAIAKECVGAYRKFLDRTGLTALARMLDAIAHDHGRLAAAHASEWRERFDKTDALARDRQRVQFAQSTIGFKARRALEQQPGLAREFYAWLDRHAA